MSDDHISASDAGLVLERLVTQTIPVLAWFKSSDEAIQVRVTGYVISFTQDTGLVLSSESVAIDPDTALPAVMTVAHDLICESAFRYADDTQVRKDLPVGSGLQIDMPNGDKLVIMEVRL